MFFWIWVNKRQNLKFTTKATYMGREKYYLMTFLQNPHLMSVRNVRNKQGLELGKPNTGGI